MRVVFAVLLLLPLAGCDLVYKLPTRQGNVLEQKEIDKLTVGMTREQVRFVLGTPIAASGLREDRWDYFGYYKPPRGKPLSRTVSLYFEGDKLVRMEGNEAPKKDALTPDAKQMQDEQKKAADEKERLKEEKEQEKGIIAPPKEEGSAPGS
jgi:outer membrane protein assembly factor BamE